MALSTRAAGGSLHALGFRRLGAAGVGVRRIAVCVSVGPEPRTAILKWKLPGPYVPAFGLTFPAVQRRITLYTVVFLRPFHSFSRFAWCVLLPFPSPHGFPPPWVAPHRLRPREVIEFLRSRPYGLHPIGCAP